MLLLLLACTDPKDGAPADDTGVGDTDTTDPDDTGDTETGTDYEYAGVLEEFRREIRAGLRSGEASGAQVAIWKDGVIVFSEGIGTKDPDTEDPVLTTTLFEVGSDTKKMTAIALLQQVDAGRATLESTVADVLPDYTIAASPDWASTTTIHELLSHQGGLYDYTPWDDAPDDAELASRADRFAANGWAVLPSGVAWNYSNPNFSIAGLLTEQLNGRAWADIIEQDLFTPLGLTRSFTSEADVEADGDYAIGSGYYLTENVDTFDVFTEELPWAYGRVSLEDHPDNGWTRPAGLVWSTAEDMVQLLAFLLEGNTDVLSDDMRSRITSMQVASYPALLTGYGYGYGVMVLPDGYSGFQGWQETPLLMHGGNTLSYTSTWCALPEHDVIVTIQSNGYGDAFTNACIAALEGFGDIGPGTDVPEFFAPAEALESYVGTWYDPYTVGTIDITTDGTDLFVSMPDLEAAGITVGETLDLYGADVAGATLYGTPYELVFYDGLDGQENHYIVNRLFAAERVGDVAAARAAPRNPGALRLPRVGPAPVVGPR